MACQTLLGYLILKSDFCGLYSWLAWAHSNCLLMVSHRFFYLYSNILLSHNSQEHSFTQCSFNVQELVLLNSSMSAAFLTDIVFGTLTDNETPGATESLNNKLFFYKTLLWVLMFWIDKKKKIVNTVCIYKLLFFSYREFIENHLLDFTRKNPGIVVYLKPRRHRIPVLYAEYCKTFSFIAKEIFFFLKWI